MYKVINLKIIIHTLVRIEFIWFISPSKKIIVDQSMYYHN